MKVQVLLYLVLITFRRYKYYFDKWKVVNRTVVNIFSSCVCVWWSLCVFLQLRFCFLTPSTIFRSSCIPLTPPQPPIMFSKILFGFVSPPTNLQTN